MHENRCGASKRKIITNEVKFTAVNIRSTAPSVPIQQPPMLRSTRCHAAACEKWAAIALPTPSGFRVLEQKRSAYLFLVNTLQE